MLSLCGTTLPEQPNTRIWPYEMQGKLLLVRASPPSSRTGRAGRSTEQHLVAPDQCASEEVTAGSAFVESPGQVHSVTNTGDDLAVIWWATIFPKSDGIVRFNSEFRAGGVYPVDAPNCN